VVQAVGGVVQLGSLSKRIRSVCVTLFAMPALPVRRITSLPLQLALHGQRLE
jgi:hypothetical protein